MAIVGAAGAVGSDGGGSASAIAQFKPAHSSQEKEAMAQRLAAQACTGVLGSIDRCRVPSKV